MFDRPTFSESGPPPNKKELLDLDPHELDDLSMSSIDEFPDAETPPQKRKERGKQEAGSPKIPSVVGAVDWQAKAACRPPKGEKLSRPVQQILDGEDKLPAHVNLVTKRLCGRCAVRKACLQYALDNRALVGGIWGGTTADERKRLKERL